MFSEAQVLLLGKLVFGFSFRSISQPRMTRLSLRLLQLMLLEGEREFVVGDLEERFVRLCMQCGIRQAYSWLFAQILRSTPPLICRQVSTILSVWLGKVLR